MSVGPTAAAKSGALPVPPVLALLFAEPTYVQSVAVYFVAANLLVGIGAAVFWLVARPGDGTVD